MSRVRVLVVAAAVVLATGQAGVAAAQGYGVYEQSACAMGRGGATVASPCPDGSTIFYNPAGLSFDKAVQVGAGAVLIAPRGDFTNNQTKAVSALKANIYPVPNLYLSKGITDRVAVGFGLMAPYGLTTDWPEDSEGRFLGYKSVLQAVYLQPTVAYKINDMVSVGAGLDLTYVKLQLNQRVDLAPQVLAPGLTFAALGVPAGTDFADVEVSGHTLAASFHVGVLAKVNDKVSVGARYLSKGTAKVDNGTVNTEQIKTNLLLPVTLSPTLPKGTPIDALLATKFADGAVLENGQKGSAELPLPAQFVVGTAVKVSEQATFFADLRFTQWSAFDELVIEKENSPGAPTVTFESYKNTTAVHLGVDYAVTPRFVVRGGFFANSAAAPDQTVTPNLPEGPRKNYAAGVGLKLSENANLDVTYHYFNQPERAGRTTDGGMAKPTASVNNGVYNFYAHLFGVTLGVRF